MEALSAACSVRCGNEETPVAHIEMYSSMLCPFCFRAKSLLQRKNVEFEVHDVDGNFTLREEMMQRSGRHTVPQIFIDGQHIGGCDDLYALEQQGRLDPLLGLQQ